jgi:hypothetical protein
MIDAQRGSTMVRARRTLKRRLVAVVVVVSAAAAAAATTACEFTHGVAAKDGGVDAIPDAGLCKVFESACAGRVLRRCTVLGQLPEEETCPWGCTTTSTGPHCGQLVPSGGAVLTSDLSDPSNMLLDTTIGTGTTLYTSDVSNGSAGEITNSTRGSNNDPLVYEVRNGIGFVVRNNVGIFRFKNLTINGTLSLRGSAAVALVAVGDITINGRLDAQGSGSGCGSGSNTRNPGPGGFAGGSSESIGSGPGGGGSGSSVSSEESGGGGGGHGATGGSGAKPPIHVAYPTGGPVFGDVTITSLRGGAGGGGGGSGGNSGGDGGGGGGAVQLVASGTVRIMGLGNGINAGGCGGEGASDSGGGGGAGGTILIEAPSIVIDGAGLAVDGGGGGGGGNGSNGQPGQLTSSRSRGGSGSGSGGSGGAAGGLAGLAGVYNLRGGGGGGAVGRIRLNTYDGTVTILSSGFISPSLTDNPTSATIGIPNIQ